MKILEKRRIVEGDDIKRIVREFTILRRLNHPNIISLYELLETEKSLYIVTEFVRGG